MLSLFLLVACIGAFGDERIPTNPVEISLERAILDFNEASDSDREKLGLLRLTENEVLAAIRGTTELEPDEYHLFTEIADSKKLPTNAKIILYRRHFANGFKSSVWNIVLLIKKNEKDHFRIVVRNQYLSTEKDPPILRSVQTSK